MKYLIIVCVLAIANCCHAQATAPAHGNFSQGTFVFTTEAEYGHSFNLSPARFESGSFGLGYYFWDNFALTAEAAGYSVQQPGPDSVLSEFDLKLRHHIYNSGAFSVYFDGAGGVSYANSRTPASGTYYNFTIQTGPGVSWQLADHIYLIGGIRYWHLSNARIDGPNRNPSINALQGYVGMMLTF